MEASSDWKEYYRQGLDNLEQLDIDLPHSTQCWSNFDKSHSAAESRFLRAMTLFRAVRTEILEEWNGDTPPDSSESDSNGDDDVNDSDDRDVGLGVVDDARPAAGGDGEADQWSPPRTPYVPLVAAAGRPIQVYTETLQQLLTKQQMGEPIDQLRKEVKTLEPALAHRAQSSSFPESSLQTNTARRSSHSASSKLSESPTYPPQLPTPPEVSLRTSRFQEDLRTEEELVDESLGQGPRINTQPHPPALLEAVERPQPVHLRPRNRLFPAKLLRSLFRK